MKCSIPDLAIWIAVHLAVSLPAAAQTPASPAPKTGLSPTWAIHDPRRPHPPPVRPGTPLSSDGLVSPPSDAIVLFDGKNLSHWQTKDGELARWKVESGYMEVVPGAGNISSQEVFGDCQVHLEWAAPAPPAGRGQSRGNSGVFLMGLYEVQILDCFENETYADGQAAAVYGQYPPLVNACRHPGEWQTYDIVFHRPRFDTAGRLVRPARLTLLHNGVLVQDGVDLTGPTAFNARPPYRAHPDQLPLVLQNHDSPVRLRNIWVRRLPEPSPMLPASSSLRPVAIGILTMFALIFFLVLLVGLTRFVRSHRL